MIIGLSLDELRSHWLWHRSLYKQMETRFRTAVNRGDPKSQTYFKVFTASKVISDYFREEYLKMKEGRK
jgi:hypothetical protein